MARWLRPSAYGCPEGATTEVPSSRRSAWRGSVIWAVAILAVLAVVWFAQAVAIPFWQVRTVARDSGWARCSIFFDKSDSPAPLIPDRNEPDVQPSRPAFVNDDIRAARRLGTPETAARKVRLYLRLPRWATSHRVSAVCLLQHYGQSGIPVLLEGLEDPDPVIRDYSAFFLGKSGPGAEVAVPALAAALNDPDQYTRKTAAWALGKIGPAAGSALPALAAAAQRAKPADCVHLAYALSRIGPGYGAAAPRLVEALAVPDAELRRWSRQALARAARDAVPALTGALHHVDPDVRIMALDLLSQIGPDASAAVPSLEEQLKDPDGIIRGGARKALESIRSGQSARPREPEPTQR